MSPELTAGYFKESHIALTRAEACVHEDPRRAQHLLRSVELLAQDLQAEMRNLRPQGAE